MLLLYIIAHVRKGFSLEIIDILWFVFGAVLYIAPMLLLSLAAQKNDIIDQGTYTCVLYAFFTGLLLDSLTNVPVLISNFLVILGLNNLFFLKNIDQIKARIFNTAMFIALASLAYFWSIAFLIPMFLAISYYEPKNYRNWIIPLFAILMILVLSNCFTLLFYDSFFSLYQFINPISTSSFQNLEKEALFSIGEVNHGVSYRCHCDCCYIASVYSNCYVFYCSALINYRNNIFGNAVQRASQRD